jgi:histone chaperone ASF1
MQSSSVLCLWASTSLFSKYEHAQPSF